jgi:hypothetical protein
MQYLIYFGKEILFQFIGTKFCFSIRNMFAENVIQAALEQVKTTRGILENFIEVFIYKFHF